MEEASAQASSASSINEDNDNDSIFGDKIKRKPVGSTSATQQNREVPQEPLIIKDNKEDEAPAAAVSDLPSVSHLPDPNEGKAPVLASPLEKK